MVGGRQDPPVILFMATAGSRRPPSTNGINEKSIN